MNLVMPTSFDWPYVVLSYVVSAIGAFVALTATPRIAGPGGRINAVNLVAAGLALGGIGVWSMHFIGMLALDVEMSVGYSMAETLVSLLAAVVASATALAFVAVRQTLPRVVAAGVVLGLAVCVMHYLGMYGMRFGGYLRWALDMVGVSMLIAVVAATAALWLAFTVRRVTARVAASLIMAAAVCAMHYTGMAAAEFVCTTPTPMALPRGFGIVAAAQLPALVATLAIGMAFVISVDQVIQRLGANNQQQRRRVPAAAGIRR